MEGCFLRGKLYLNNDGKHEQENLYFSFSSVLYKCNNFEDSCKDYVGFVYVC